jgi:hypothetical protein
VLVVVLLKASLLYYVTPLRRGPWGPAYMQVQV